MAHRGQAVPHPQTPTGAALAGQDKKKGDALSHALDQLLDEATAGIRARGDARRRRAHVLAQLVCLRRHTVTGLLTTCGRQFSDWSPDYRLYCQARLDPAALFGLVRRGRPRGLDLSERMLPSSTCWRQFHTLLCKTLKVRAATPGFIPLRTASMTRNRSASCASGARQRASVRHIHGV